MDKKDYSASGVTGMWRIDSYSAIYTLLAGRADHNGFIQELLSKSGTSCVYCFTCIAKVSFSIFSPYLNRMSKKEVLVVQACMHAIKIARNKRVKCIDCKKFATKLLNIENYRDSNNM